jgi:neutral ceramidase
MTNTLCRARHHNGSWLQKIAQSLVVAACAMLVTQVSLAADTARVFKAGAGQSAITIDAGVLPVENFTEVRDALQARVVLFDNGATRVGMLVVDQTSLQQPVMDKLRQIVSTTGKVAPDNVLIGVSHTFSAPHISLSPRNPEDVPRHNQLFASLSSAVQTATEDAVKNMQDARIGFGAGTSHVNVSRDVQTADGWWLGSNELGHSDKSVGVVRVDGADGKPLAVLMNYAVQPSIMNESIMKSGGRAVTADLAGAATRHVEQQYGSVSMFLVGAAGDQAPLLVSHRYTLDKNGKPGRIDAGDAGYLLVGLLGERLGTEVVRVNEGIKTSAANTQLKVVQESVAATEIASSPDPNSRRATRSYDFVKKGDTTVPFWIMQVGDVAFVGLQPELSARTGQEIKARSPFKKTVVMTMVNGAAKYMPDAGAFDKITYEALGSRYAKGDAEKVAARIVEVLKDMQTQAK